MTSPALTTRQAEVLAFIVEHKEDKGYPPTIREIAVELGISSPNGLSWHMTELERKGYIRVEPGTARGIVVLQEGLPLLGRVVGERAVVEMREA